MKRIPLTKGQFAIVDDEDYDLVRKYSWAAKWCKSRKQFYGRRQQGIEELIIGTPPPGHVIDHKNQTLLDLRRRNLRYATRLQNNQNRRLRPGASGFKGVWKNGDKWAARITIAPSKKLHLGQFKTQVAAAKAYNRAARKWHGEFAVLNQIPISNA